MQANKRIDFVSGVVLRLLNVAIPPYLRYNSFVKLTAKIKLQPSPGQADALKHTLEITNACCDWLSAKAWNAKVFGQFAIHKLWYYEARKTFPLTSQMVVRAIAKVADSYKLNRNSLRTYRKHGAIAYDDRILRFSAGSVNIWTVADRQQIPYIAGERQYHLLEQQQGETDLIYHRGKFYLAAACNVDTPTPDDVDNFLGIDLGVTNIASDSDGNRHSGSHIKSVRYRHRRLRTKLQKKQTRAAKRRLKKLAGKEARFARHTNHVISKEIVACAEGTQRGIKLEDLKGIRDRVDTVCRRKQRAVLHSWAFHQLRAFLTYKALLAGVQVVFVNPRNTSRECAECGHITKENRRSQSRFRCVSCHHEANADTNAARVISGRAASKPAEGSRARLSDRAVVLHG